MKQAFVEPFPFNLDEFVTVDEVGDEVEDHNPSSSGNTTFNLSEDDTTSPVTSTPARKSIAHASPVATPEARCSAETEAKDQNDTDIIETEPINSLPVTEKKVATNLEDVADTTDVQQTVIGEVEKEEILTPESEEKAKECVSHTDSEEASLINEDTINKNKGDLDLNDLKQLDSSGLVFKDEPTQVTEPQEPIQFNTEHHTEHQSEKSESALQEPEIKELPSQDTLLTLDEVGGEDGDFADEEEILKCQASENPEALLTVDEVGGDEAEVEEEQLKKALEDLVTLDEIVEEEDEDDAGSFNPEVSIFTLLSLGWFESNSLKWCNLNAYGVRFV